MDFDSENKSKNFQVKKQQSCIKESIKNAIKMIQTQMQQFINMVDDQLLKLENFLQDNNIYFHVTQKEPQIQNIISQPQIQKSQKQISKISTILNYLISSVTKQACKQLQNITKNIIPQNFNTVKTLYLKTSQQIIQLQRFWNKFLSTKQTMSTINQPELNSIKIFSKNQQTQMQEQFKFDSLLQKYGLKSPSSSNVWNNKHSFEKHSHNMQLLEPNKIKSIDIKVMKQKQHELINEIMLKRNQLKQISQKTTTNQTGINLQTTQMEINLKLESLYKSLFQINLHSIVYQTIAWPQINNTNGEKNNFENRQLFKNTNFIQHKIIQFKLQAQGFTASKNINSQNSIKSKIQKAFNGIKTFSQQELIIIKNLQKQYEIEQDKFFQFGLIDELISQTQKNKILNKISIKIINIQGKFFIQSLNQAKLIKLNPLWQYFGLKILQQPLKDQVILLFYGLVKKSKGKNKQKTDKQQKPKQQNKVQFEKQNFLNISLPPTLKNTVLKPFFLFKGFHCKVSIKND